MEVGYSITFLLVVIAEDIPQLDTFWRHEVRDAIREKLATRPDIYGKPLRQTLKGCRKLRVGDYRVVFRIEKRVVQIIAVLHRSTKYKGVEKRV